MKLRFLLLLGVLSGSISQAQTRPSTGPATQQVRLETAIDVFNDIAGQLSRVQSSDDLHAIEERLNAFGQRIAATGYPNEALEELEEEERFQLQSRYLKETREGVLKLQAQIARLENLSRELAGDACEALQVSRQSLMTPLPDLSNPDEVAKSRALFREAMANESLAHLRQIWLASTMRASQDRGKFPDDLASLYGQFLRSLSPYKSPRSKTKLPPNRKRMDDESAVKWIRENCDYLYFGKGKTSAQEEAILACEDPRKVDREQLGVLYVSGRAELLERKVLEGNLNKK